MHRSFTLRFAFLKYFSKFTGPLPYGMDFLVKDNKTNEVLLLGEKQWIHIYASDDSQFLAEVNVGQGLLFDWSPG